MSLNVTLQNAVSGLSANQRALDVTAQNIANVDTEGYTRKTVQQEAVVLNGQGAGVRIADITRKVNQFLLADLRDTASRLAGHETTDSFFSRMQDLFGAPQSNGSISARIADFAAKLEALATTPEDLSSLEEVASRATIMVSDFDRLGEEIQSFRLEADRRISDAVSEVNTQLGQVQDLNLRIAEGLALGHQVGDLQDQRDRALSKIAENMDYSLFERDNGEVVLFTKTGRPLLDRSAQTLAHAPVATMSADASYGGGQVNGITLGGTDITAEIGSGRIAALVKLRDETLPDLNAQLAELAHALTTTVNAIHNQGSGFPPPTALNGSRVVAGGDAPPWSGNFRVAAVDENGTVSEAQTFDLSTYATVADLVAAIDGMANINASLDANGRLSITGAGAGDRVAVNELDSSVALGGATMGAAAFFGLNDFFSTSLSYSDWSSARRSSATAAVGVAGTLTVNIGGASANVAYGAGDSLNDIAAALNGSALFAANQVQATVETDGSGVRLRIHSTATPVNVFLTDSAALLSTLDVEPRGPFLSAGVALRADIAADPGLISRGRLDPAAGASDVGVSVGDNTVAQALADALGAKHAFGGVGALSAGNRSFSEDAAAILGLNATQASAASSELEASQFLHESLSSRMQSISGVNLDEEMANMIALENAYAATARVITTTSKLFDVLVNMV